jgi:flagellar hook-associated protein 1 FlgK
MAGLTSLLNTARDALSAQSFGLSVTGQNVANANTPLYVRRDAVIQTRALGTQSAGTVETLGIRRAVDAYADRRFFEASSNNAAASQYDSELQQIETAFNDLGGTGLGTALDAVFKSFQQLAARPDDTTVRAELLDKLDVFASRSRQIGDTLATQRTDILERAKDVTREASLRAQEIAKLNEKIVFARQNGEDAADLIDQRNKKLLNLSELIDTRTVEGANGAVMVQAGGTTLVEGSFARTLGVTLDSDGSMRIMATRAGGAQPDTDITNLLSGGKLAGLKAARDEDLFDVTQRFDRFIFDVASAINTQHAAGVGLDGSTGLDVFDVGPTAEGSARSVRVSADVFGRPEVIAAAQDAQDLPGGSDNAVRLGDLQEMPNVFGSRTASQAYGDLVGQIGVKRASARSEVQLRSDIFQQAEGVRDSTSGVSLDEEMVGLQRYQRAYEAAGKVISTVDQLLEELMNRVGR